MRLISCAVLILTLTSATSQDNKQPPKKDAPGKVLYTIPLVARPGEKQKLVLRGKNLDTAKDVKVSGADGAKVKFIAARKAGVPNNYPAERIGDSEVEIELELPKDAKPGEVKLLATSPSGETEPFTLLLRDGFTVVVEKEENAGFDTAQLVTVPCAIEGTIKGERDVDVFRFEGKKGDRIELDLQAARHGSPVDAILTLYDAEHVILAAADDTDNSPDPRLKLELTRDGMYYLSVIDAHDLGGANFGYRLVVKVGK